MRWFPVAFLANGISKSDTWRNQTDNPCVVSNKLLTDSAGAKNVLQRYISANKRDKIYMVNYVQT